MTGPERPVLWSGGEPIAWVAVGEPVIGETWADGSMVSFTRRLSPREAVELYGPVEEVTVGPAGGFQSATYGTTTFRTDWLDPRLDIECPSGVIVVNDPDLEWPCPKCGAQPGQQCLGANRKHQVRRAHGVQYDTLMARQRELETTVRELRTENTRLDEWATAVREKHVPRCRRPTRAGEPCRGEPVGLGTLPCRTHLTPEMADALDALRAVVWPRHPGHDDGPGGP